MWVPMAKRAKEIDFDEYDYYEGRSHWWIVPVLLVVLLIAAYVAGMIYFKDHTMPNATVNGQNVGNMTLDELEQYFDREVRGYTAAVTGSGVTIQLAASDIDLSCNSEELAASVMNAADPMLWPIELTQDHETSAELTVDFDETKLAAIVTDEVVRLTPETGSSLNASSFTFNEDTGKYELADETYASVIDGYAIYDQTKAGILNLENSIELTDDVLQPNTEAQSILDQVNTWLDAAGMELYLDTKLGETTVAELDAAKIKALISFDENGKPSLNYNQLEEYTRGPLSAEIDTYNVDRKYTRYDGKKVEVPAGTYGWMIDGTTLAKDIYNKIMVGDNSNTQIATYQNADWVNYGGQDWGYSYMDIDLTEQHARLYGDKGVLLWESDIVSGTPDGTHNTPTGAYYFTSKETNIRLVGPLVQGTPEWDREVAIWYGVVGDSIGLHSAQWRADSEYGGDIYTWNGSHGCINIPEYKARELWDLIEIGDPVIVHY